MIDLRTNLLALFSISASLTFLSSDIFALNASLRVRLDRVWRNRSFTSTSQIGTPHSFEIPAPRIIESLLVRTASARIVLAFLLQPFLRSGANPALGQAFDIR